VANFILVLKILRSRRVSSPTQPKPGEATVCEYACIAAATIPSWVSPTRSQMMDISTCLRQVVCG